MYVGLYSHTNAESLAQICDIFSEIRNFFFSGIIFYWHTLYVCDNDQSGVYWIFHLKRLCLNRR